MSALAKYPTSWRVEPMSMFEMERAEKLMNDAGLQGKGAPPNLHVVRVGRDLVGCGAVLPMPDGTGWLCCVATRADMRKMGIATSVLAHLIERARRDGLRAIWLETMFWNKRFYEGRGFDWVPIDTAPKFQREIRASPRTMMMAMDIWRQPPPWRAVT